MIMLVVVVVWMDLEMVGTHLLKIVLDVLVDVVDGVEEKSGRGKIKIKKKHEPVKRTVFFNKLKSFLKNPSYGRH